MAWAREQLVHEPYLHQGLFLISAITNSVLTSFYASKTIGYTSHVKITFQNIRCHYTCDDTDALKLEFTLKILSRNSLKLAHKKKDKRATN